MLTKVHRHDTGASHKRGDAITWGTIFSLATIAVGLLFWMGSASHAGEPLATVASIGLSSLALCGLAAFVAVKFSLAPVDP
ncbi:hypothetical protein [Rhizobacter fulvus]